MTDVPALVDTYLGVHAHLRPVDATFMGLPGHDHRLPGAGPDALTEEAAALGHLRRELERATPPATDANRLDARLLRAALRHLLAELERAPRYTNPAWYSGETVFGVVSLLLPRPGVEAAETRASLLARLHDVPRFLAEGRTQLRHARPHPDLVTRAALECRAFARLMDDLPLHPQLTGPDPMLHAAAAEAARAALSFADGLRAAEGVSVACGEAHLNFLMREVHGLDLGPREALERAEAAFQTLTEELESEAHARFGTPWREVQARLDADIPEDAPATYRHWHERAMGAAEAAGLVTPTTYGLDFQPMPEWARSVAGDTYFLFYRSPAALRAGTGSVYWMPHGPASVSTIKLVHAVHHGSIGHHTQNAHARVAPARLARLGGTDCASGLALLSAGTMVEGWACYAEDLLAEAQGFYTPEEELLLTSFTRRNAGCCIADIKLHLGEWTLDDMRAFYKGEVGFAPSRLWTETTRNAMLPATRLMYWLGTEKIRAMRAASPLSTRDFHDRLLAHGHAPLGWVDDLQRSAVRDQPSARP